MRRAEAWQCYELHACLRVLLSHLFDLLVQSPSTHPLHLVAHEYQGVSIVCLLSCNCLVSLLDGIQSLGATDFAISFQSEIVYDKLQLVSIKCLVINY